MAACCAARRRVILTGGIALALLASGCASGNDVRSPQAICTEAVPNWVTAAPTTVGFIRHFKTGILQTAPPFAHAFGSAPDRTPAAWCWTQVKPRTFRAYAASAADTPVLIAEISGASDEPPRGAPTIL